MPCRILQLKPRLQRHGTPSAFSLRKGIAKEKSLDPDQPAMNHMARGDGDVLFKSKTCSTPKMWHPSSQLKLGAMSLDSWTLRCSTESVPPTPAEGKYVHVIRFVEASPSGQSLGVQKGVGFRRVPFLGLVWRDMKRKPHHSGWSNLETVFFSFFFLFFSGCIN